MKQVAFWGSSPPSQPYFGQPFVNISRNVYAPDFSVFDGQAWITIDITDITAGDETGEADPGADDIFFSVAASAPVINLAAYSQRVIVVTGTQGIISLGLPSLASSPKIVIFGGSTTINCSPGLLDLPLGRPIFTAVGDVATFFPNGSCCGWRLGSYTQALIYETTLQTAWAGFGAVGGLLESAFGGVHLVSVRAGFASVTGFAASSRLAHAPTLTASLAAVATLGQAPFGGSRQIAASVAATGAARFVNT